MFLQKKNILVIDDTFSIRTFLRISLQAYGAEFYEATNADEGLKICEQIKPDLVVLDLGLPDKDGLDILQELKKKGTNGKVPKIIILSVRKEQRTKDHAFALGADGYITKPFLMEELIKTIEQKINK